MPDPYVKTQANMPQPPPSKPAVLNKVGTQSPYDVSNDFENSFIPSKDPLKEVNSQVSQFKQFGTGGFTNKAYSGGPHMRLKYPLEFAETCLGHITFTPIKTIPPKINTSSILEFLMREDPEKAKQKAIEMENSADLSNDLENSFIKNNQSKSTKMKNNSSMSEVENSALNLNKADKGEDALSRTKVIKSNQSCTLYIPPGYRIRDDLNYNTDANLNRGGAIALGAVEQGGGLVDTIISAAKDAGNTAIEYVSGGLQDQAVGRVFATRLATGFSFLAGDQYSTAFKIGMQAMLNPNTKTLFNGVRIRSFPFSFNLNATSAKESAEIEKIVRFFRTEAYPKAIGDVMESKTAGMLALGWEFPNRFEIKSKVKTTSGHWVQFGPKIKPCYLTSVDTSYNPGGQAYFDDGKPRSMQLNLAFSEYSTISRQDVEEGF